MKGNEIFDEGCKIINEILKENPRIEKISINCII
jgi:hypothetical protein